MTQNETIELDDEAILADYGLELPSNNGVRIISVDETGLRDILLKLKNSEGHIADLAPKLGISPQMLGDVLAGRSGFGPKLLKGMGVVRTHRIYDLEVIADE